MLRFLGLLTGIIALAVAALGTTANAAGGSITRYNAQSFAAAQDQGKTIVVDVHASWCPTCKAQAPILSQLAKDAKNVKFVRVDFDRDKAFLRQHRIPRQSTILVFKGKQEVGRSIAETNRTRLRSFVLDRI
ncbi:thioredoxin family protein [Parerythrobacter jejuensis]|uniref:Redoxin family protein n=1 Tax=Parerythrobacter jejuensis TaxID=795812 RepID=A0A845AWP5_9SPHN|nr:thioredoxin family protein [Parerythrobacter jejuensis]MXP32926.1 redoxin family protein [Parerythrobacter jejuensis]